MYTPLERIIIDLERLDKELSDQINAMDGDKKKDNDRLRNDMLEISSTYTDQVLVLRFITFVNDKLETKQQIFSEIVTDTLKDLIRNKQILIQEILNCEKNKKDFNFLDFIIEKVKLINEIKSAVLFGAIIVTITFLSYKAIIMGEEVSLKDIKNSTESISNSLDLKGITGKIIEGTEK